MEILNGFATLFSTPDALAYTALAAVLGVVIGSLPGLTVAAAIAMLVPVTYYLDPLAALSFLYVIGKAGRYGGSISAILFNTPGTTASVATIFDGYPLARRGDARRALRTSTVASMIGDWIGDAILIFGAVIIASWTSSFGPAEYFGIYMMAFLIIGSVVGKSILKGLLAIAMGLAVAMVGLDPITGQPRWTFGHIELEGGFGLVPLLVGLFVISEIMVQAEQSLRGTAPIAFPKMSNRGLTLRELFRLLPVIGRSAIYGAFIGMMPGLGSSVAAFVAYAEEKRRAGPDAGWGEGAIAGVAAPEAANNAVNGPSMIPLLTLGVPGTTVAAILMGVFLIHGIPIGPTIFSAAGDLVYGLFAAGVLGVLLYGITGWFFGPAIGRLVSLVPTRYVYPTIFLVTVIASYSVRLNLFDVYVMMAAGLLGYVMRKLEFPTAAFIIAFILAPGAEESLRQSLLLSRNGWMIFLTEPVAAGFLAVGMLVIAVRTIVKLRQRPGPADIDARPG